MGHDVYVEHASQLVVRGLQGADGHVAGVGDHEVDRPVIGHRRGDQVSYRCLVGHVAGPCGPANPLGHLGGPVGVTVGYDKPPCPLGVEPLHQRPPDAAGPSGDHGHVAF